MRKMKVMKHGGGSRSFEYLILNLWSVLDTAV